MTKKKVIVEIQEGIKCGRYCYKCKKTYWLNNKQSFHIRCCVSCRVDCDKCINDTHFKRL